MWHTVGTLHAILQTSPLLGKLSGEQTGEGRCGCPFAMWHTVGTVGFADRSIVFRGRALPNKAKVECGTPQTKSGTLVNLSNSGFLGAHASY